MEDPEVVKVEILLKEFFFTNPEGTVGGSRGELGAFRIPAEKPMLFIYRNEGTIEHEAMWGGEVMMEEERPHGYMEELFEGIEAEIFATGLKGVVETECLHEVELEEEGVVWVYFEDGIPAEKKGEWEIDCFVPGHYEAGMFAPFIVE